MGVFTSYEMRKGVNPFLMVAKPRTTLKTNIETFCHIQFI